jgi:hypothetical protein
MFYSLKLTPCPLTAPPQHLFLHKLTETFLFISLLRYSFAFHRERRRISASKKKPLEETTERLASS